MTDRLVLLHGWGATQDDLTPLGQHLADGHGRDLDVISLEAPEQHPQGTGRQWYGLFPPDWTAVPQAVSALQARLHQLVSTECPLERTVLLGFSQGGAMALDAGCQLPLAAVISCSGYPHPEWVPRQDHPPVLLLHGSDDEVVPSGAADQIWTKLDKKRSKKRLFTGGHTITGEAMEAISAMLQEHLH